MFDHVKFGVTDFAASKAFFLKALEPIGVTVAGEGEPSYGIELVAEGNNSSLILFQTDEKPAHLHLAFAAQNRAQVDAFYRAALAAGANDHGRLGCGRSITRTITQHLLLARMGITSKSSATHRNDPKIRALAMTRKNCFRRLRANAMRPSLLSIFKFQ